MSLLDYFDSPNAQLGLGLLAAAAPRSDGAGFGQRLMEGVQSGQSMRDAQTKRKVIDMQMQEAQRKIEDEQRQRAWRTSLPGVMNQKVYGSSDEGPTMAPDAMGLQNHLMSPDSPFADKILERQLFPKEADYKVVGDSLLQVGSGGVKPVYTAQPKPAATPSAIQEYEYAKNQGYKGTYQQWTMESKKAGATSVSVNTGQKGLDNTLKVRGDFRSEPIYKAHGEVQSAHSQITQSLKMASPAGDLAGATKLMKILDPGSVVRESELGMAMAASGLMDRTLNYADMVIKGTKLTPTQRKDFQSLSDALLKESQNQYNAKRNEYKGIAERNQLSTEDILGPEPKTIPSPAGKIPMLGQVVDGFKFKGGNPADPKSWEKK